jgi:hypothetical protein
MRHGAPAATLPGRARAIRGGARHSALRARAGYTGVRSRAMSQKSQGRSIPGRGPAWSSQPQGHRRARRPARGARIVWLKVAVGRAQRRACAPGQRRDGRPLPRRPWLSGESRGGFPRPRPLDFAVQVVYEAGRGILSEVPAESTRKFAIVRVRTQPLEPMAIGEDTIGGGSPPRPPERRSLPHAAQSTPSNPGCAACALSSDMSDFGNSRRTYGGPTWRFWSTDWRLFATVRRPDVDRCAIGGSRR